jgi:hypothetical protein
VGSEAVHHLSRDAAWDGLAAAGLSSGADITLSQSFYEEYHAGLTVLAELNRKWPCCTATAIANHLYLTEGILASQQDVLGLHLAAAGDDGASIPDLLEVASSGFAGTRISAFWPVADLSLPGIVTGLRLPGGAHASLLLTGGVCVSWGSILPVFGQAEEGWWLEWR